jgi:hypothetical protein
MFLRIVRSRASGGASLSPVAFCAAADNAAAVTQSSLLTTPGEHFSFAASAVT